MLEWGDIDEEKRTLKVTKNMVRVDGKNLVQRTTKTESGRRTIPLNGRAMEAVQHLKTQAIPGCPYVFATQIGKHLSYRNLMATMENACEATGVQHRGQLKAWALNLFSSEHKRDPVSPRVIVCVGAFGHDEGRPVAALEGVLADFLDAARDGDAGDAYAAFVTAMLQPLFVTATFGWPVCFTPVSILCSSPFGA